MDKKITVDMPVDNSVWKDAFVNGFMVFAYIAAAVPITQYGFLFTFSNEGTWLFWIIGAAWVLLTIGLLQELFKKFFAPTLAARDIIGRASNLRSAREELGRADKVKHPHYKWILIANLVSIFFIPLWIFVMFWAYSPVQVQIPEVYGEYLE